MAQSLGFSGIGISCSTTLTLSVRVKPPPQPHTGVAITGPSAPVLSFVLLGEDPTAVFVRQYKPSGFNPALIGEAFVDLLPILKRQSSAAAWPADARRTT